jgi:YegS/Rv2252/BmrU family lipid kinase
MIKTVVKSGRKELLETACDRERVAILFNPASGAQKAEIRRARLEQLARAAGLTGELGITDHERGATPLAEKAVADGMERLLVCGGDGSLAEAAGVLAGTPVALAALPGGTGNLIALNLGLPTDRGAALRLALTGAARPVDVGRANGQAFLLMAGMGLDAHMIRDANRALKDRLGVLAYFVAALRNLRRRPVRYAITIDGRHIVRRGNSVLVANMGKITGGLKLVPGADPEDGLLEVVILRADGLGKLALLLARTWVGRHAGDPLLEIYRGREILIETTSPQPVQFDGNLLPPTTRLHACVEPQALPIVRPPGGEATRASATVPVVIARYFRAAWGLLAGGVRSRISSSHVLAGLTPRS